MIRLPYTTALTVEAKDSPNSTRALEDSTETSKENKSTVISHLRRHHFLYD